MTRLLALPLALIAIALLMSLSILAQDETIVIDEHLWDLSFTAQEGQFSFFDAPTGASTTGKPVDVGDFDGNGCGDIAVTGQNASHPIDGVWRGSNGHVRIIMNRCVIAGEIAMNDVVMTGSNFFTIFGAYDGDMAGTETYVDDFNGDGYDDLLFSAQNSDGPFQNRSNAGAFYILFGSENFYQHADIDLRQPQPDVLTFYGASAEDRLGLWVEGGDFDGDGIQDALVGANQADGISDFRANAGEAWIIYGAEDMLTRYEAITDLQTPPEDATRIIGADYDDLLGSAVWGADFNNDGFDDAVVSAGLWRASSGLGGLSFGGGDGPANQRYNSGESFVVFGHEGIRGQVFDLAEMIDVTGAPLDERITVIYGADANDLLGEEIASGDLNGDGQLDLILGTLIGDGVDNTLDEAGEAWIIYTDENFAGQMIDLATPPENTVVIYPDQTDSKAGDTLRAADMDNDGIDDLFYGAPDYDPTDYRGFSRVNAGLLAVIFGEEGGLPNDDGHIMLFDPPEGLRLHFLIGPEANDMMPYALAIYDVDNDGVIDIIPNAMGGDGAENRFVNAGEIYIVNGAEFLNPEHAFVQTQPLQTPTPWPTSTAVAMATASAMDDNGDASAGKLLYEQTCFGCHGMNGEGVIGLGLPLVTSPLVIFASEDDLLRFLQEGRPAGHPENRTGVSMPPGGGRPDWGETELLDIVAYLRQMRDDFNQR